MSKLLPILKRYRRHLIWAVTLLPLLLAFNYYTVIPICMRYSKPVTYYMEWGEKAVARGTPKRITFRIPSAYLMPNINPELRSGGKVRFIHFMFNTSGNTPGCLYHELDSWEREAETKNIIFVTILPIIGKALSEVERIRDRETKISEDDGFDVYSRESSLSENYVPNTMQQDGLYFNCLKATTARKGGCTGHAVYKRMYIKYIFRRTELKNWQEIQKTVFDKIDSFTSSIDK